MSEFPVEPGGFGGNISRLTGKYSFLLLKPRTPCFSSDYFGLAWKDFGQQDALDFFITINTAIS